MKKIPVIIDCDTGVDDSAAIVLALASDRLDVLGFTATWGADGPAVHAKNTLDILKLTGKEGIPVALGGNEPMRKQEPKAEPEEEDRENGHWLIHGKNRVGDVELPASEQSPSELSAVELMAKLIRESDDSVVLVGRGPMTNIGLFLETYPELKRKLERICMMGGSAYLPAMLRLQRSITSGRILKRRISSSTAASPV